MSSIRPLVTITVLALVGVFLYLKINETEPPLPEGVEDWSADTELQMDMGGADPAAAPQFTAAPSASEASAFSAETAATAPPASETAPAFNPSAAPSFTPDVSVSNVAEASPANAVPPVIEAPSFEAVKTEVANSVASTLSDLPTLPALPTAPSPSTAPSVSTAPSFEAAAAKTQAALPGVAMVPELPEMPPVTASPVASAPVTAPIDVVATSPSSLFSLTRIKVQAALDRGELSQALLLLSDWYGDPSLSASETAEVSSLLGQLAGSVIYSTEHRLEPPYMVQAGEQLETIAKKYDVPWQLLAKINGLGSADQLQPGQQLKVMRGPFSALVDISQRKMTLMLDRRYAGEFPLDIDPSVTVEEGHWEVNQKLLTPASASQASTSPITPTEERSLMLTNSNGEASQVAILRGATSNPLGEPTGRVLRMNPNDATDVFDILTLGSKVVIRR